MAWMVRVTQPGRREVIVIAALVAALAGSAVAWTFYAGWGPVLSTAMTRAPAGAKLEGGRLSWPGNTPIVLAQGPSLAVVANAGDRPRAVVNSDVVVELGARRLQIGGAGLEVRLPYPAFARWPASLRGIRPQWERWLGALTAALGVGGAAALMAGWSLAARLLAGPWQKYANRWRPRLEVAPGWRFLLLAFMPGAVLMSLALWAYAWGLIRTHTLVGVHWLHLLIDGLCLAAGPLALARCRRSGWPPTLPDLDPGQLQVQRADAPRHGLQDSESERRVLMHPLEERPLVHSQHADRPQGTHRRRA